MSARHRGTGPLPPPGSWSSTGSGLPPGMGGPPPPPPPAQMPPPPPPPADGVIRDGPAWERRTGLLDLGALFATLRDVLFDPGATFRTMVRDRGLGGPLLYLLILATVSGWIALVWDTLLSGALERFLPAGGGSTPFFGALDPSTRNLISAVILPGFVLLSYFIWTGIVHLFLMMMGGAKEGFETTARVIAYVSGSTAVFSVIPVCGGLIGLVWGLVSEIIGLSEAHQTGIGSAIAAVLLPLVLCCLCVIGLVVLAISLGASMMEGFSF